MRVLFQSKYRCVFREDILKNENMKMKVQMGKSNKLQRKRKEIGKILVFLYQKVDDMIFERIHNKKNMSKEALDTLNKTYIRYEKLSVGQ